MYEAPVRDLNFVIKNLINLEDLTKIDDYQHFSDDLVDAILEEAGKIGSEVLDPCNLSGDHEGSKRLDTGEVKTPQGYKEAYQSLRDGGWFGLEAKEQYGGQQIPVTLSTAVNEIWHSSNMSLALCHLLTQGLIYALQKSASEDQKNFYIPKLASGEWTGTMNLTEPQAGTDLSSIKTKAVKENGHYKISGQKIYITYGEHDLSENIIHLVLAKTPDAPEGNKGISVFIVPKFIPNEDGSIGKKNDVTCLSIERKLGVKGSPTAVLQFGDNGGAIGYLVGEENQGLKIMFEMMNHARFSVGVQGLAVSERAFQQSKIYAFDRVQGIPIDGKKGDPIIDHPDVLRLASTMKAEVEAMRALAIYGGFALDMTKSSQSNYWESKSSLMIPIIKGWLTERSLEITSNAIQIYGGMGFIEETGIAQHYRDARILPIYEGTTAIQANDLVFRKTLRDNGKAITDLISEINNEVIEISKSDNKNLKNICERMSISIDITKKVINHIVSISNNKKRSAVSGVNYLMMLGYIFGGWMMIKTANKSVDLKNKNEMDEDFLNAKISSSMIYFSSVLPKIESLSSIILQGDEDVLSMKKNWL
ncbi:acyl-CoA dehydrogenase [Alphaproteobacteria bacterium]|jgi:alkylation response protein AidB-like acyl-CoA dehydrogenase|nr:acyl-CoA dehydrogenase [Alphaproteobacteria bacterium]MDB0034539.1 acyl-CoA dehydrogenase [Alphaproteobacteria bacterium]